MTEAGGGKAYISNGDGSIGVSDANGGIGFLDVRGNGDCGNAHLDLVTQPDGDAFAVGTLPFVATGGTGALRGLTGNGTVTLQLELRTSGTDNIAQIDFSGSLDVLDPVISVTKVASRYPNFGAFLQRKLTVTVTFANDVAGGDSLDFQVTAATGGLTGAPTTKVARFLHGTSTSLTFTLPNAVPGRTYNAVLTATTKDGLRATQFPVPGPYPVSITAPRTWGPAS